MSGPRFRPPWFRTTLSRFRNDSSVGSEFEGDNFIQIHLSDPAIALFLQAK